MKMYQPKKVIDLGSQNDYSFPHLPAPYISEWWLSMGVDYTCVDLNGENNAWILDLAETMNGRDDLMPTDIKYDMVLDIGTSEHIGRAGKFDWEAIYNCWESKFDMCKTMGLIVSENPKTGNWPGHSFQFYTEEFYHQLEAEAGLQMIDIGEVCAMGNCQDGRNVYSVYIKISDAFPDLETFKTFSLKQS